MQKMTKAQAGALGGRAGKGGRKHRTRKQTPRRAPQPRPAPAVVDPLAARPGETEHERRMRLGLPVLEVSNPAAPAVLPPGFTIRPHYQS